MSEPATKDDLEELRKEMNLRFDQNSLEHGSIITVVNNQNRETRGHIGNEIETVRNDVSYTKTRMQRVVLAIKRFLERHGMKSDGLDD